MEQQQQMNPQEGVALALLMSRVDMIEKTIGQVNSQLANYVPIRENDLKLQNIQDMVRRIEAGLAEANQNITLIKEHQDKFLIRILYSLVATIITIATGVLIGYITHLFK